MFNRPLNRSNIEMAQQERILPAGEYDVLIKEVNDKVSQRTGIDMIELTLEILNEPHKGKHLRYYINNDKYADEKVVNIMSSCGREAPHDINSNIFRGGLIGKVKTKQETYNGELKASVNYWITRKAGQSQQAQPAQPPQTQYNPNDQVPF